MNVTSALNTGVLGVNRGLDGVQKAASDIAGAGKPESPEQASGNDVNKALTDLAVEKNAVAASTKVVQSAEETLGTLIDIRA
ncbi:hypothetical protein [Amphritea balenae]|uniref:Flagellar biosynthesis protein FlgE n=1 Tax=Amphritea balenae TaxID=452629 RepID=A0A3P1SJV4_9GAMM|nr:hypothetical protein [Amphritea balenae]RRC97571.1 hypothetical protein EHS89_17205 [Amphritea balenae]GGK74008.1 hypothetical protein GCM10007941_25090 [Amphritea balenae]